MEVSQIVWLVVLVLSAIVEGATVALVSIWFCAGALAALITALVAPGAVTLQIVMFLVVSGVFLLALRPLAKRMLIQRRVPTNADAAIGKRAQVVTEIQPGRFGRVVLEGQEWTAKSDSVLEVGRWCVVNAIEGVKLVVSPAPGQGVAAEQ